MAESKPYKIELFLFLLAAAMVGFGLYYFGSSITSFAVKELSYADATNLLVTANGSYTWQPDNAGDIKSVKIDGRVTTYGKARVYVESNGIRYLVFDSTKLNESKGSESANIITGLAVKEENDKNKKDKNKKPDWNGANKFIINGTTLINLLQYFTDKDNDALIYSASSVEGLETTINNEIMTITPKLSNDFNTTIILTASDGIDSTSQVIDLIINVNINLINETINTTPTNITINQTPSQIIENQSINITPILNETQILNNANETNQTIINQTKTIAINMAYNSGTIYDANDNGEESVHGIVDLSVENTKFGWDADSSKLCTRWEVYSIEDSKLTTFCNGNSDCCAFVNLVPTKANWSEIYYSAFGKDGASHDNIVSAQVIYYDANLSALKSEIYNSEWANLSVKFFEDETEFSNICLETCSLSGLNKSSYTLIFEVEDNAILKIDKIKYSLLADVNNNPPVLLKNFSTINIEENKNSTINLSEYFADPDGDALAYGYYKVDNITILLENNRATILPSNDFEGIRFAYMTANDSENIVVSNLFMINVSANQSANISPSYFFEIRNKADEKLAVFDSFGNLKIKGILIQNSEPVADENDFSIQNSSNGLNAVIKNPEGNFMIKGALNENQSLLVLTPNSFIVEDKDENVVAYINSTGDLFLNGILMENASFGS